jgi:hypothetical protein
MMTSTHSPQDNEEDNPEPLLPTSEPDENCDNEPHRRLYNDTDTSTRSLPWLLQILFGLNGFSLSLSSLSLMYIVNTRVGIPLHYLPTYGAIAFLPYSLKPLYGYLSQGIPRHRLFVALLSTSSLSVLSTTLIPPGGVFLAFVSSFFRGVTDSWAELCLGLTLIDHARTQQQQHNYQDYDTLASRFQSQAATARNFGALLASLITCLLFVERQLMSPDQTQLTGAVANALLITTGGFQLIGALVAYLYRNVFRQKPSSTAFSIVQREEDDATVDEESALRDDEDSHPSYSSQDDQNDTDSLDTASSFDTPEQRPYRSRANWILVVLLQLVIILIAMQRPITERTSHIVWKAFVVSLLLAIVVMALAMYFNNWWQKSHRVGLFLVLRHAIPSDAMLMASFFYTVFESRPLLLQVLSLVGMVMTTLSSWSYGKLWSRFSSGHRFLAIIAGTTLLAALASLSNLAVANHTSSHFVFWIALAAKVVSTFFGEWAFLPDVVLATKSVSLGGRREERRVVVEVLPSQEAASTTANEDNNEETTKKIAIEYGTLISCLDFGDQLGAFLAGPIVALLGISRENDFLHLNRFILLSSLASVLSLGLLPLLGKK